MTFKSHIHKCILLLVCLVAGREMLYAGNNDFTAVTAWKDGFAAAGPDCGIVLFSASGAACDTISAPGGLLCIVSDGDMLVAGGDGILLAWAGGRLFTEHVDGCVSSAAILNGQIAAAVRDDASGSFFMLVSSPASSWASGGSTGTATGSGMLLETTGPKLKCDRLTLSTGLDRCFGITDGGFVISSRNFREWSEFDFNKTYEGFYPPLHETRICAAPHSAMIAGLQPDGTPACYITAGGSVWSSRPLEWGENGSWQLLRERPLALCYDKEADRFVMACTGGVLFLLPACSHCNSRVRLDSDSLRSVAAGLYGILFAAGNAGFTSIVR